MDGWEEDESSKQMKHLPIRCHLQHIFRCWFRRCTFLKLIQTLNWLRWKLYSVHSKLKKTELRLSCCLFWLFDQMDFHEAFPADEVRSKGKSVQLVTVLLSLSSNSCPILMSLQGCRLSLNPLIYFDFLCNLRTLVKVMFCLLCSVTSIDATPMFQKLQFRLHSIKTSAE